MEDDGLLTFDEHGFVRMDELPDVDPDLALPTGELDRVRLVLRDDPIPQSLDDGWDAMVDQVDTVDGTDSIGLIPDDADDAGDAVVGPIVLVADDPADGAAIDAAGAPVVDGGIASGPEVDNDASIEADDAPNWTSFNADPALPDPTDTAWATDDPLDLMGLGDDPLTPSYDPLDTPDDPLDTDVVEFHPDDGGGNPGFSPH